MAFTYTWEVDICDDCLFAAESFTDEELGHTPQVQPLRFIFAEGRTAADTSVVANSDEAFFSWSPCEGCGSALGGNRRTATVFVEEK